MRKLIPVLCILLIVLSCKTTKKTTISDKTKIEATDITSLDAQSSSVTAGVSQSTSKSEEQTADSSQVVRTKVLETFANDNGTPVLQSRETVTEKTTTGSTKTTNTLVNKSEIETAQQNNQVAANSKSTLNADAETVTKIKTFTQPEIVGIVLSIIMCVAGYFLVKHFRK